MTETSIQLQPLKTPLVYYGSKTAVAAQVWEALGDVTCYSEPFVGSAAVLLARPSKPRYTIEIANDIDCLVVNFWRSVTLQPDKVAQAAYFLVHETELHTRTRQILQWKTTVTAETFENDPTYCDPDIAGAWMTVTGAAINANAITSTKQRPTIGIGKTARTIVRSENPQQHIHDNIRQLHDRIRQVIWLSGDWTRAVTPSVILREHGTVGVFLDPPYDIEARDPGIYPSENIRRDIAQEVADWAVYAYKQHPDKLRIVVAGYSDTESETTLLAAGYIPQQWRKLHATASKQAHRERLYMSPNCVNTQPTLI